MIREARPFARRELVAQVGSTFTVSIDDGVAVPAVLTRVVEGPEVPGTEQFSLLFTLPVETPPVQRTYELEHPALGAVCWFLVPIDRTRDGLVMEAVFNWRTQSTAPEG